MTSPKHTEAPSRIELPDGFALIKRTKPSWDLDFGMSKVGRVDAAYAQKFAAAMNRPASPRQAPVRSVEELVAEWFDPALNTDKRLIELVTEGIKQVRLEAQPPAAPSAGVVEAIDVTLVDLGFALQAVRAGDPQKELELRVRDIMTYLRNALAASRRPDSVNKRDKPD